MSPTKVNLCPSFLYFNTAESEQLCIVFVSYSARFLQPKSVQIVVNPRIRSMELKVATFL